MTKKQLLGCPYCGDTLVIKHVLMFLFAGWAFICHNCGYQSKSFCNCDRLIKYYNNRKENK